MRSTVMDGRQEAASAHPPPAACTDCTPGSCGGLGNSHPDYPHRRSHTRTRIAASHGAYELPGANRVLLARARTDLVLIGPLPAARDRAAIYRHACRMETRHTGYRCFPRVVVRGAPHSGG